jgi:hypothetical protein
MMAVSVRVVLLCWKWEWLRVGATRLVGGAVWPGRDGRGVCLRKVVKEVRTTTRWACDDSKTHAVSVCFSAQQTQAKSQWIGSGVIVDKLDTRGTVQQQEKKVVLVKTKDACCGAVQRTITLKQTHLRNMASPSRGSVTSLKKAREVSALCKAAATRWRGTDAPFDAWRRRPWAGSRRGSTR